MMNSNYCKKLIWINIIEPYILTVYIWTLSMNKWGKKILCVNTISGLSTFACFRSLLYGLYHNHSKTWMKWQQYQRIQNNSHFLILDFFFIFPLLYFDSVFFYFIFFSWFFDFFCMGKLVESKNVKKEKIEEEFTSLVSCVCVCVWECILIQYGLIFLVFVFPFYLVCEFYVCVL